MPQLQSNIKENRADREFNEPHFESDVVAKGYTFKDELKAEENQREETS